MVERPGNPWQTTVARIGCTLIEARPQMLVEPLGNICGDCLRYKPPSTCEVGKHPKPDAATPSCKRWAPRDPGAALHEASKAHMKEIQRELCDDDGSANGDPSFGLMLRYARRVVSEVASEAGISVASMYFPVRYRLPQNLASWTIADAARVAAIERMGEASITTAARAEALRTNPASVTKIVHHQQNASVYARRVAPRLFATVDRL